MKLKKTVKGFTLVELLIVSAIFGILMIGAMALMKPVSLFYRQTVEYEAARSSMDMISDYIEGALKLSTHISIFDSYEAYDPAWVEMVADDQFGIIDSATGELEMDLYQFSICNQQDTSAAPANVTYYGTVLCRKWNKGANIATDAPETYYALSNALYYEHAFDIAIRDYSANFVTPPGGGVPYLDVSSFDVELTALAKDNLDSVVKDASGNPTTSGPTKTVHTRLLNISGDTVEGNSIIGLNPYLDERENRAYIDKNASSSSRNFHVFYTLDLNDPAGS